ncbi:carboxypeptidase-like regulatory domain-containing protein [Sunxiuqinia sp. sy24]|uniref:carboxypeptidase-like regulatory domain-containing protein n=1 Tax=Sunxiuqinia sp. sy24 TaxID=3461495 RepID=UPI00404622EC
MKTPHIVFSLVMLSYLFSTAGNIQNTNVYGRVVDKETQKPLYGVSVCTEDEQLGIGTITNEDGDFRLWNLPSDTINIMIRCEGYETYVIDLSTIDQTSKEINVIYMVPQSAGELKQATAKLQAIKKAHRK